MELINLEGNLYDACKKSTRQGTRAGWFWISQYPSDESNFFALPCPKTGQTRVYKSVSPGPTVTHVKRLVHLVARLGPISAQPVRPLSLSSGGESVVLQGQCPCNHSSRLAAEEATLEFLSTEFLSNDCVC